MLLEKGLGFFHEIVRLSIAAQLCTESFSWIQNLSRSGKEERVEKKYTYHRFFKTHHRALKESRVRVRVRASFWAHPQQDYQRFP
jgi:hypothetical protein